MPEILCHRFAREINVRAVREQLGMSQRVFARAFGFSVWSVRNWEHNRRRPTGAVLAYLRVIEAEPEAVQRVVGR